MNILTAIPGLFSVFGFVLILGIALVVESVVRYFIAQGWNKAKIKFTYYEILSRLDSAFARLMRR
ncbi:hypothetical protein [Undibacterium oligocarboniphilum]|uniref:Uncharacterized protein n=1 Tax=Undibacterium oligocarboniphilum TaxID=666702 RepID=A0A850QIS9_9BURK|nr:hypothetical protein [Undibacterium oligocarboniphilum]MBC3871887.1 hypothetical protein [Undibacterium oligocarboniphilum]NVO79491.1 hypothetical protein [Undibacterium oligocarboniphilum]